MPPPNEDERYHDLLRLIGQINQDLQSRHEQADRDIDRLRQEVVGLREEMRREVLEYWKATQSAIRQLSDWFAKTEDTARDERREVRTKRDRRERIIIGLLLAVAALAGVVLGILLYVFR